jgi:hypothetical protein
MLSTIALAALATATTVNTVSTMTEAHKQRKEMKNAKAAQAAEAVKLETEKKAELQRADDSAARAAMGRSRRKAMNDARPNQGSLLSGSSSGYGSMGPQPGSKTLLGT